MVMKHAGLVPVEGQSGARFRGARNIVGYTEVSLVDVGYCKVRVQEIRMLLVC